MDIDPALIAAEDADPAVVHDNERAGRMIFSMIVLQAIYDLSSRDKWTKWDAIQYFHSDTFPGHCWEAGLDPDIVRDRLIKDGKLPSSIPPPPPERR